MHTFSKTLDVLCGTLSLVLLNGCVGMSDQEKSTAIGDGVGAVGGSIQSSGSAAGTLGGAAVGDYLGHEIEKIQLRTLPLVTRLMGLTSAPLHHPQTKQGLSQTCFWQNSPEIAFCAVFHRVNAETQTVALFAFLAFSTFSSIWLKFRYL